MNWAVFLAIFVSIVIAGLLSSVLIRAVRKSKKKEKKLKCTSCGEWSCVVISQNYLGHIGFGANFNESGFINPYMLTNYRTPIEDWIIGDQDKYSCCEKCGYYEKIIKSIPEKTNHL